MKNRRETLNISPWRGKKGGGRNRRKRYQHDERKGEGGREGGRVKVKGMEGNRGRREARREPLTSSPKQTVSGRRLKGCH